jgi:hypothetical protein
VRYYELSVHIVCMYETWKLNNRTTTGSTDQLARVRSLEHDPEISLLNRHGIQFVW